MSETDITTRGATYPSDNESLRDLTNRLLSAFAEDYPDAEVLSFSVEFNGQKGSYEYEIEAQTDFEAYK